MRVQGDEMDLYELMMKRRSARVFKDQEVPEAVIEKLIDAANNAPSGGNIQPLSIVLVLSVEGRTRLAQLSGDQPWVRNAPVSMIFCLDFFRVKKWAELCQTEFEGQKAINHFLIAYADLIAAAQNVVILAEGFGLGSVYIGSILNEIDEMRAYYEMPKGVVPMMVLTLGYPKSVPETMPKLKKEVILHRERYRKPEEDEIRKAFDEKYGPMDQNVEKYLQKAFVEALEAGKQDSPNLIDRAKKEMKRLEIQNNAQFLFKVRYPARVMVRLNQRLAQSFRNAGFEIF